MPGNWYDDHTKVAAFSTVLEDAGVLNPEDTRSYKNFVNKPFQYDEIYSAWAELGFPSQDDANWQEFIDLLDTDEEDDGEENE